MTGDKETRCETIEDWNPNKDYSYLLCPKCGMCKCHACKCKDCNTFVINKTHTKFKYGRNDTTKSEELLQLPSDRN